MASTMGTMLLALLCLSLFFTTCSATCSDDNDCVHGKCTSSACVCEDGYKGETCKDYDCSVKNAGCGDNGRCESGKTTCTCNAGFTGTKCENYDCTVPNAGCGDNGKCNSETNTCTCNAGFTGTKCESAKSAGTTAARYSLGLPAVFTLLSVVCGRL